MKPSNLCLPKSEIPLLLSGDLPPDEAAAAESHIAECESCRSVIESMIADSCWWDDARHSLAASATHVAASLRDAEGINADAASLGETRLRESVLGLLGPTDDPNMLGRIGSYEIIGLLGQGGMGAVFKGFDRSLNRFVAIKMLLPHLAASGAARKRFAREGQAVAAVVDDHVMAIHCVDEWQGVPYLVMTYSRGVSLQKRLIDNGPLEVREILRIGMQAAKGLAAAHAQGIVHRDIKPANIFLDQNVERVQLMDFGLARAVDDASLTRSGTLAGTPQYMSPEQARAETVDHRSDLFSLGSVMYAMCTGHAPFRAESSYSVLRLITDKEPHPIREINSDIPDWLCTIINKLMAKQVSERFDCAKQVADLLEDCLAHVQQPTVKKLPESLTQHLVPRSGPSNRTGLVQRFKRFGIRAWLLAAISVTAFMLIAMMLQDNGPQRSGQGESGPLTVAQARLNELVQQQKAREESIRQISYHGTVRQYAQQEIKRTNTESVDEFVARCVGLALVYDDVPPYPLSASRDFNSGVYRFTMSDINTSIPKYMDWFIDKKKSVQLMGRAPGTCEAVVTNNREDIRDDREASLVRLDIAAFRPVKDFLMSEVVMNATSVPGIPDVGGRPLWKLEKLDNNKVGWKATFMFQQPIANPPGAKQILWHRVYWEQVGGELVIVRVDKLTVDGDENSTPQSVTLIDDYRSVCGKPVPFRVRFFGLGNTFVYGAELLVSDLKVNDYVDVPDQMPIPAGSPVRNLITGTKSQQPASQNSHPTTDAELIQGTWNVVEMQQVGYEPNEGEPEFYKSGGYKITFTKNKMIHSPDHSSLKYLVDATKTPGVLEFLKAEQVTAKAIYELDGDEHRLCQGRTPTDGSEPKPPTSFDIKHAAAGEFPTLMILRRTKPIEPIAIPMRVAVPDAAIGARASGPSGKQNPKRLQIREATIVEAGADSSLKPVESKVVEFSGMRLRLNQAQPAILTEDDIMTVESVTDPNNLQASQIVLTLTPEAGERFLIESTRLSSQPNPGYLAIEFDGTVLSAPRVNDKISNKVAISASKDDDMERLVAAIRESIPTQPTPIQRIQRGLTSNQSDAQKAQYLRQFFSVGESYAEVLKRLQVSEPGGVKGGPLQTDIAFDSCDIVLSFDAERKLFRIGYYVHSPALQSPEYHELVPDLRVKVKADRQIVNEVVRAFMKDAGDIETTKTLTRDLPQAVTARLFSLASENALNELHMEFDYVNDHAEPTKAIAALIALTFEPQSIGLTKEVFVVFRLTMTDDGWVIDDIDFESKEHADRELKSFLNANPKSVPSMTQMILDRSNARSVVEAYVALALSGDIAKAAALAKNGHATADPKRIAEIPDFLNVQRLKIQTVYVNDPANPKKALATSAAVKLEEEHKQPNGQRDGFMVLTLELTDDKWFVIDIDFESESDAEKELKRFLEANPNSIGLPPLTSGEVAVQNTNVSAPPAGEAAKAAPAESPLLVEARKALQACQNSLSWKQKFDMRVTNSYVHSQVGKVTIESRVRRDAPRMVESSLQTFDDQPKDHIRLDDLRLDDGEMFISRTTTVGQKKLTGLMTIKGRQKASWRMFESSSSFAMEGHFPGNQGRTLMELLMESKQPDVRMEKIGDHDCLRISDRNDWGTMTVWIDAGPSRRLRQCESFKERGNHFADGRVGEDKDTANLESFSYFVEDIQYKLIDGIEIAVSCRVRSTSIPNGGIKQENSTVYKRTEIHLRPDFAINNPFVGDFDNGARINDGDAFDRNAAFRWQDGKLTPAKY